MSENDVIAQFEILETGSSFISKKAQEFGDKYPKKFIAVLGNELIAVDDNFDNLMLRIRERNMEPNLVLIEYIPGKGEIILY